MAAHLTPLLKLFGLFWFADSLQKHGGGAKALAPTAAQAAQQPAAWPAAAPSTLPPFPDGWEIEAPAADEVQARAAALLSTLWSRGEGATQQEMVGGRWITFQAGTVPGGHKGIIAWHVKGQASPTTQAAQAQAASAAPSTVIPVGPAAQAAAAAAKAAASSTPAAAPAMAPAAASPAAAPAAAPSPAYGPPENAAIAMANALTSNGYRKSDQPIYKAVQRYVMNSANPDGFPGTHTMTAFFAKLDELGIPHPQVKVYPWLAAPGYDGTNAPLPAEWNR